MNNLANKLEQSSQSPLKVSYKSPLILNELINSLPEAVITTDPNFKITGLNPVAEAIYGLPLKDAIGQSVFELISFEIVGVPVHDAIQNLFENGFWSGDVVYYTTQKQKLYFNTRCTLIKDDQGKVSAIVLVNHNISEQNKQERQLAQIENKYQTVVESLSEGVMLITADGKVSTANKKAIEILGITNDVEGKAITNPDWKAVKEDYTPFPIEEYPAFITLRTGVDQNNIIMGLAQTNSTKRWLSINTRGIYKDGEILPEAVIASFIDITEMKEAGQKLRESEILFSSFINNSQTANWIYDEDGYILLANNLYDKINDTPGGSVGKHILEIFPKELGETLIERNKKFLAQDKPLISENRVTQADGSVVDFISYLFHINIPGKKRLIGGQAIDATKQKHAIEKLKESEVLFRSFMGHSHNLGWVYDEEGNLIYGNPVLMETVGLSDASLGKNIFDITNRRVAAAILEKNKKVLETGETIISEDRFVDRDGNTKHFIAHYFLLSFGGDKKFVGGHALDITERKKMQAQLVDDQIQKQKQINQATLEAQEEERNRISGELHDNVNQLLMSSKLHIGIAKKGGENQTELLDKATEYLLMAVEEIRALSRSLNSSVVATVGLQNSINDIAKNLAQLNQIETTVDCNEEAIELLSEEQQLMIYRIVQEQSNNIIKYAEATEASISINKINKFCHLIITDNGKGFDKEKTELKGIGLINIFNRVDAYNGRVKIESSSGNGVTLKIIFPFAG